MMTNITSKIKGAAWAFTALCFFSQGAFGADLNLDPATLNIKVYRFAVSTSETCENPIVVYDGGSNPSYVNVLDSPTIGQGSLADGTYPCAIMEFSDNIQYTSAEASTSGNCQTGTTYTLDVCSAASNGTVTDMDGNTITCDDTDQKVTMYMSTLVTDTNNSGRDGFKPPESGDPNDRGFNLSAALTVSGTATGSFVVNGTDQVCDTVDGSCDGSPNSCEMQPPSFSFSNS